MNKQHSSTPRKHYTTLMLIAAVAGFISILSIIIMLSSLSTHLNRSLTSLQDQIAKVSAQTKLYDEKLATLREDAVRANDDSVFQTRVIEAMHAYVAHQQKEKAQQKIAAYKAADTIPPKGRKIYGNMNARFTLVEFSDIECPYCKRFHPTPKKIVDASGGEVNWEWKHLPLAFHNPGAQVGAHATECVAEQKGNIGFWAFLDDLFAATRGNGQGAPNLVELATGIGADADKFTECMQSGRYQEKVNADLQEAQSRGINGTPATFIVDNQTGNVQLLSGAQPEAAFLSVIARMKEDAS